MKQEPSNNSQKRRSFADTISLAVATCGVGYLPVAPGTWGSLVALGLFLIARFFEVRLHSAFAQSDASTEMLDRFFFAINLILVAIIVAVGIWAADRAAKLLDKKDPSEVVIDEVMGQFITFLFVPLTIGYGFLFAGFLLFRLFDIFKPYPIDSLQKLKGGLGICADDILAGVYAGVILLIARAFIG
jgi:phosphatidylglycerophosphatase A